MILLVLSQVLFALEAIEAAVGLVVTVLTTVGDEVGALAEGFATHLAHMRLLTWDWRAEGTYCIKGEVHSFITSVFFNETTTNFS